MKHLKLFFALFAMLALNVGNAWGAEVTETIKMKGFGGKTNNAYQNVTVSGTSDVGTAMVAYAYNGSTGQVRGNKTTVAGASVTSADANKNWSLYNSEAMAGAIKSITITQTATSTNKFQNQMYVSLGTTTQGAVNAITNAQEHTSLDANTITFDIDPSKGYTYFKLLSTKKFATGTIAGVEVKVTYEITSSGGEEPTPPQLTTPANLKEASITETSATLSWNAVANASNYSVTINGNNATATTNSYNATGLTAGTEYTWSVVAKGDGTNYTDSEAAQHTFTTTAATTPDPEPGTGGEETWTLVTNASDLKAGDQIVIAAKDYNYAISTTQNTNNRGQAAITKSGDNITFGSDVQILTLEAGTKSSTFALNTGSGYLYASSSSGNQLKTQTTNNDNGSWSISISSGTATIKANGTNSRNVMQYNQSSTLFACYSSASQKPLAIYKKVTSSGGDEPSTPTPSITLYPSVKDFDFGTVNVGETPSQEFTITTKNTTAALTASIDNTTNYAVSAITGNKVTVTYQPRSAGTHSAVLTVKAGEEATATVNLTGKAVQALEGTWILVTDASSLKAGDEIIIASKDENYALSIAQNSNNRGQVEVTKTDNTITATSEAQVLTLQAGTQEGTLALYTGAGYLHAASSSANHLKTETELSDNSSWTIAVEADGTATLTAQGTYTRNTLCYNKSNKLFACYASTNLQQPIVIYKNTNGQQLAGLAYATTKYLTKLGDTFTTPTLTNHNSLTVTYSSSDNNVATVDNTGTITIKAAGVVVITAAFAGDASYLEGSASYTIGVTEHAGTQADPYSVADARRVIDVMETATDVYATGVVSEIVTAYNSEYGNITYNISVDGTTTGDQLQAYRGKGVNGVNFTSADDVKVGDEVVVKGNLKLHNGSVYEFDANNELVSLVRNKAQADLAYEETEHTANVGEDFAEPALTNPNNLTVTYSSSNTTVATVNATTGEVTILAAGKVTITATTAGDATYSAGSASYNITITNPGLAVATLPFTFNGNKTAIENTAGMTQNGLGSDYSASTAPNSQLKFDNTGDWVVIRFDSEPEKLSYDIKNNSFSGGTFSVQESADGETYTDVTVHSTITEIQSEEYELNSASRYVKFIYTTKSSGNVGLGNIKITKFGEEPEQPGEGGGETPGERLTEWVLTPLADITTNDLVVITMTKGETTWAMTNDNGASAAPAAPVVTLSADALAAEPDANLKWVVSNNNGTLTIYPYGGYETWLYCTNTNNGVRVGTGDAKEFTIDTDHLYTTLTTDPRYLGVYDGANWRCYTSINSNIEDQTLAFYVKKNANDVLPGTGEDPEEPGDDPVVPTPTINPTATFIFNTAEGLNDLGIIYPETPTTVEDGTEDAFKTEFENNATFTQDGITMTTTGGTVVATRVWLTAAGKLDLRVYKGATLTFSVPAEHKISAIVFDGSNIGHLLVNGNAVSGNAWTGSEQTITFTAKADAKTIKINTIAFVVEYTRDVTNTYGTICLPYASASTSGAYFYEVVGKGTEKGEPAVYLASVNTLKAGVPYIFEKTANTIKVVYSSEKEDTPQKANGLIGNFTNEYVVPANNYILYRNEFIPADGTTNKVNAYRAYLNLSDVDGVKPTQTMPGRRYIGMSVQGENEATGFENITAPEGQAIKVIENGQLIIIRDGVKYNVQGQVIK